MLSQYRVLLPTKKVVKVTNVDITLQGIAMYYFSCFADGSLERVYISYECNPSGSKANCSTPSNTII